MKGFFDEREHKKAIDVLVRATKPTKGYRVDFHDEVNVSHLFHV